MLASVPTFRVDELLGVLQGSREARKARLFELCRARGLEPSRVDALDERVEALCQRALAASPPPSPEALALGLLSLIALEARA